LKSIYVFKTWFDVHQYCCSLGMRLAEFSNASELKDAWSKLGALNFK